MFQAMRFGKVLGQVLGHRDPVQTKAKAVKRFGAGITLVRVI